MRGLARLRIGLWYGLLDRLLEGEARREVERFYEGLLPYDGMEEELRTILTHETRLCGAARLQSFIIWMGNKGYLNAVRDGGFRELAKTLSLALLEADLIDERDDEYSPELLGYVHPMYVLLDRATRNLRSLVLARFRSLHPGVLGLYEEGRRVVEEAQAMDREAHTKLRRGDLNKIREKFPTLQSIRRLPEGKLGCIASYASRIDYRLSGGSDRALEDVLADFWFGSTTLLQVTYDDYRELEDDVRKLDTNVITLEAIRGGVDQVDYGNILKYLKNNPEVIARIPGPYINLMRESLKRIKERSFNYGGHKAVAEIVEDIAEKEMRKLRNRVLEQPY